MFYQFENDTFPLFIQKCDCLECQPKRFHSDNYCDDNLNTKGCLWDGGDCCRNPKAGWNFYCSVSFHLDLFNLSTINVPKFILDE